MRHIKGLILIGLAALLLGTAASCGGRFHKTPMKGAIPLEPKAYTLQDALVELDALEKPEGVDDVVWNELKGALREALETKALGEKNGSGELQFATSSKVSRPGGRESLSARKLALKPPTGAANKVNDLTATRETNGDFTLSWHYRNLGDYDQNGVVGVSDITPLALHYNETYDAVAQPDCIQAVIDGSGNGKIGVEDVTQIAQYFGVSFHHYAVEGVDDYTQPYLETAQVALPAHGNAERAALTYNAGSTPYKYYRVVPVDADGERGDTSNVVSTQPGVAPQILSVSPTAGDSGTQATFMATVTGDGPFEYSWDFGGGAAPGSSVDVSPTVTLANGGTLAQPVCAYQASLTVNTPFGAASYPFTLNVTAWWHVEQIPKVPGYDVIGGATYFYGPDGSLWGLQSYSSPLADNFLVRIIGGQMAEYEKVDGTPAVDRENNPARVYRVKTGFMSYDYYFTRRIDGQWSDGELLESGVTGIKSKTFFNSENQPVIVYSKSIGTNSYELWAARRDDAGVWVKTLIQEGVPAILPFSALASDDSIRICYTFWISEDEGGIGYARISGDIVEKKVVLENQAGSQSYDAHAIIVSPNLETYVLVSEYDYASSRINLRLGVEENGIWNSEFISGLDSGVSPGTWGLALLNDGKFAAYLGAFYPAGNPMLVQNIGGEWQSVSLSSELDDAALTANPQGEPTLILETLIATYW